MRRALAITEKGLARAMEVLAASKTGPGKKLTWSGRTLTSEILRAEIDSAILRAGGLPANTIVAGGDQACDPHERGLRPAQGGFAHHPGYFSARRQERLLRRHDAHGRARPRQRGATAALGSGARRPGAGAQENEARRRWLETAQRGEAAFYRPRFPDGSAQGPAGGIFPRHRPRPWARDPRVSPVSKNRLQAGASAYGRARSVLSGNRRGAAGGCGGLDEDGHAAAVAFRKAARNLNEPRSAASNLADLSC